MSGKIEISRELLDCMINALDDEGWCALADEAANILAGPVLDTTPGSTLKVMRGPGGGLYLSGVEDLREGDVFRREVRG